METFTIREAAERCDVSYQLMRKRVDRGTVSTVKRDGVRLIPRTELERTGLWPGSQPEQSDSLELVSLRTQLAEAQRELSGLRPLSAKLEAERKGRELAEQATHEHRATAIAAEARLSEAEHTAEQERAVAAAAEARLSDAERAAEHERAAAAAALEPLTSGGFISSIRALRALRSRETSSTKLGASASAFDLRSRSGE